MLRFKIDFLGKRWWLLGLSATFMLVSVLALAFMGLEFGIEFQGGSKIAIAQTTDVSVEDVREALADAGVDNALVQSAEEGGFIIRISESDPTVANEIYAQVAETLNISLEAGEVTTIGPGWGQNITNAALLALLLSITAILFYTSLRFEYKMAGTAVIALVHDVILTLGIYAIVGREVTPNTIAAVLTIIGYSLYDTVVVFHRIRENSQRIVKQTFMDMANDSINQVFVRSVNTSITSLIPVVVMLLFGGETLKDFAFALAVGLLSGVYSSVGVASPIYAMWKELEPKFQALKKRFANAS